MADPKTAASVALTAGAASAAPAPVKSAGERPHLIQQAIPVSAGDAAANLINEAEHLFKKAEEDARAFLAQNLPQSILDEMEAGRAALSRHVSKA
jgi:hypothetical protein